MKFNKLFLEYRKKYHPLRKGEKITHGLKVSDMNDNTYKLRRNVMNYVYEAKNLLKKEGIDLPRVTVRIVEPTGTLSDFLKKDATKYQPLGIARMGNHDIYIPNYSALSDALKLKYIVFHEILHAIYNIPHTNANNTFLMGATLKSGHTSEEIDKDFVKLVHKYK